jgi:hypothetical protein
MISTFIKGNTPNCVNSKIQYRSFKDFDVNKFTTLIPGNKLCAKERKY